MSLRSPRARVLRPSRLGAGPWWPAILVAAAALTPPDARAGGDCTGEPSRVALFQDLPPWSLSSNEDVFGDAGIPFTVFTSLQMGVVSLTTYDKVVIPSDQPPDFYSELESNAWWFDAWLDGGCCRVLEVHGADDGWSGGVWDAMGPAGLSTGGDDTDDMTVVTAGHRFLTTPYSVPSSSLDGVGSSAHGTIQTTLPGETIVVKDAASNAPVLIEFPFGDGWVIASTLTLEYAYDSGEHMVLPNLVSAMRPATDDCALDPDDDGDGWTVGEGDCDDADPGVFPGAPQVCDGVLDNNCDGMVDAFDSDGDSDGWTECEGDCDDARAGSNPAAEEVCTGGRDEDCDGYVDGDDWDCDEPSDDDTSDDDTSDDDTSDDDTSDDDTSDDDASDDDTSDDDASDDDASDDDASDDDASDDDASDDDASDDDASDDDGADDDASDDDSWLSGDDDDDDDDDDGSDRTRRGACTGCSSPGEGVGAVAVWALLALAPWWRVRRSRG